MKFLKLFPIFFLLNIAFAQQTIKDLTVNDFKVVNTKQGSKPCPEMTETQRNAIPSPQGARCIYNTTSGKLNIYNSTAGIWKAAGGGVDSWVTAFSYSVDDLVIQSNKIYQCLTAHTSGTFVTDLGLGRWVEISKGVTTTGAVADNRIARFDGTTGELIQSSTAVLDDSGNLSGINNIGVAGNASVAGTTTLNTSLTGVVKAVSGLLSASAVDLTTDVVGTLPIANGGTGATSKSWVDLTTNQGAIAGNKAFTGDLSTSGAMLASNLSGTNTGDLLTGGAIGSTTVTNTLKAPFQQVTPTATGISDIETGNTNELKNPRFQATTYNDGWTCSLGTMSQGVGPDGSKALSVVSTGEGFRCRQTFTSSAELKGTLARFYARIKTAAPDVKVCGLDGGILTANEVGCVTVNPTNANKVFDDPSGFFRYGDTLYGIVIYTNNAAVFPTIIDDTYLGAAGLNSPTIQQYNSQGWTPFTPAISGFTSSTVLGGRWKRIGDSMIIRVYLVIDSVSGSLGVDLPTGYFADPAKMPASVTNTFYDGATITDTSANLIYTGKPFLSDSNTLNFYGHGQNVWSPTIPVTLASGDQISFEFTAPILGWDETTPAVASESVQVSSDTMPLAFKATAIVDSDPIGTYNTFNYTATSNTYAINASAPTQTSSDMNTNGIRLFTRVYTSASTSASPARISIYVGKGLKSINTNVFKSTGKSNPGYNNFVINPGNQQVGYNKSYNELTGILTIDTGYNIASTVTLSSIVFTDSSIQDNGYFTFSASRYADIASIPTVGNVKVPGANQADHIRARFGAATIANPCTTGVCNKSSMSNSTPTSITWGATGSYNIVFPRTYGKIMCTGTGVAIGVNYTLAQPNECTNCSSLSLAFGNTGTGGSINTSGVIDCTGTY